MLSLIVETHCLKSQNIYAYCFNLSNSHLIVTGNTGNNLSNSHLIVTGNTGNY